MSGIHKSKEVYKNTQTRYGRRLVPVRGLYVSGIHTDPRYTDHVITVSRYTSSDAVIAEYIETYRDVSAYSMSPTAFISKPLQLVDYGNAAASSTSYSMSLTNFESRPIDMIVYHSQAYQPNTYSMSLTDFESTSLQIIEYGTLHVDSSMEHVISVNSYNSSTCTIT